MLLNSLISAYATSFARKVCGPVRSTWWISLGEDKIGTRAGILNATVARRARAGQTIPLGGPYHRRGPSQTPLHPPFAPPPPPRRHPPSILILGWTLVAFLRGMKQPSFWGRSPEGVRMLSHAGGYYSRGGGVLLCVQETRSKWSDHASKIAMHCPGGRGGGVQI